MMATHRQNAARIRSTYALLVETDMALSPPGEIEDHVFDWVDGKAPPEGYEETFVMNENDTAHVSWDRWKIFAYSKGEEVYFLRIGGFGKSLSGPFTLQNVKKDEWPELVNTDKFFAKQRVLHDGILEVDIKYEGEHVPTEHRTDRVWIWTKKSTDKVYKTPMIG